MQIIREHLTRSNLVVAGLIGAALFVACNDDGQIDLCDDELGCDNGYVCDTTNTGSTDSAGSEGICVEDPGA